MRTIAIINQKGGCGKTTVSINLAAVLASRGKRTLLVDMDPQSHCALGLAVPEAQLERSITDVMQAGLNGTISIRDITWQICKNMELAPSSMNLAALEAQLTQMPDKDRRLMQVLSTVADDYDYCIIDCPPSIGLLTFNALRAAEEVIIPVETGYFAMQGSIKQEATIEMLARRAGHHVRFMVLPTLYDVRTKLAREIYSELRKHYGERLLPACIHFNSKLKEAASFGQPITEYDPGSKGMQDFEDLARWLMANPPVSQEAKAQAEATAAAGGVTSGAVTNEGVPTRRAALSRAAELVERARALSARTAALSRKIERKPVNGPAVVTNPMAVPNPNSRIPMPPSLSNTPSVAPDERIMPVPGLDDIPALSPTGADTGAAVATAVAPSAVSTLQLQSGVQVAEPRIEKLFGVRQTSKGLLFVQPINGVAKVSVAGDFNGWNPGGAQFVRNSALGVWQCTLSVNPGRYRYRLIFDGKWKRDPYNELTETNPYGELNSIIEVR